MKAHLRDEQHPNESGQQELVVNMSSAHFVSSDVTGASMSSDTCIILRIKTHGVAFEEAVSMNYRGDRLNYWIVDCVASFQADSHFC